MCRRIKQAILLPIFGSIPFFVFAFLDYFPSGEEWKSVGLFAAIPPVLGLAGFVLIRGFAKILFWSFR